MSDKRFNSLTCSSRIGSVSRSMNGNTRRSHHSGTSSMSKIFLFALIVISQYETTLTAISFSGSARRPLLFPRGGWDP